MMNIFQLAENDQAVMYLGEIFGNVGFALSGTGSSILGNMFRTFNTMLLVVGTLFVVYITIVGVLTSAQEGEFMKKWNSLWTPLRMLIGIVALFPTSSGYCAIQVVVMWIVIQGVGAADMVWKTALDYFQAGGTVFPQANGEAIESQPAGAVTLPDTIKNLFASVVCQSAIAKFTPVQGDQIGQRDAIGRSKPVGTTGYQFGPDGICGSLDGEITQVVKR